MHIVKTSAAALSLVIPLFCQACESGEHGATGSVTEGLHSAERGEESDRDRRHRRHDQRRMRRSTAGEGGAGRASAAGQSGAAANSGSGAAGAGVASAGVAGAAGEGAQAGQNAGAAGQATGAAGSGAANGGTLAPVPTTGSRYQPKPGTSWQYQLTGELDASVDAELFDIDLSETSSAQITALHSAGRKVICYFDTAYEPGRSDTDRLEPYRGNPIDGWPGQYWVDFREQAVVDVMLARLDVARSKGCDAVEADDVDARDNDPGFSISAAEQRQFIITLAEAAHARSLAFGLKNALDDVPALVSYADFAVNEECVEYDECDALAPFVQAGKPVFHVEYGESSLESRAAEVCPRVASLGFETVIKKLDLDAARYACP